jgi:hypothetical protein
MYQEKSYPPREPHGANLLVFAELKPNHRRDYLDGWSHATIGAPARKPPEASQEFFNFGAIEARALTAPAQ